MVRQARAKVEPYEQKFFADDYQLAYNIVGAKIKLFRKKAGFTQKQLGELVGISRTNIVNMERGRHRIHLDSIYAICAALDQPPHSIIPDAVVVEKKARSAAQKMMEVLGDLSVDEQEQAIACFLNMT